MVIRTRALVFVLGLWALLGTPLLAHEDGVIRLSSNEVPAGGELELRGEKLPKNAAIRLQLRGTLETYPLAEVRTNAKGAFDAKLALPIEARAGGYTVIALAPDGDAVARAELTVVAAASASPAMTEHGRHGAMNTDRATTDAPHPTAEMMRVPVSMTGAERVAIIGFLALTLSGGMLLLRGS